MVASEADVKKTSVDWSLPISEDLSDHIASFHDWTHFPLESIRPEIIEKAKSLTATDEFQTIARNHLANLSDLSFDDLPSCTLLSLALRENSSLLKSIPPQAPVTPLVWCLSKCIETDVNEVVRIWREQLFHPPPIKNRADLQAVLFLLDLCVDHLNPGDIPPFTSDEYETIFALAYCPNKAGVSTLASFILPRLTPFIVDSQAAHLLFRRMLPYCAMENKHGRKVALEVAEDVVGHDDRFPSTVSTWITMHPFCVAASNNLLVDMQNKGLITSQMKNLIQQLEKMNKRLLKGKIKLREEVKQALPRSLWRVDFPPPRQEVMVCNDTCKKIRKSIQSRGLILIPIVFLVILLCGLYVLI